MATLELKSAGNLVGVYNKAAEHGSYNFLCEPRAGESMGYFSDHVERSVSFIVFVEFFNCINIYF